MPRTYSVGIHQRMMRMVLDARKVPYMRRGAIIRLADQLGIQF